jgi:hypothetical protein
VTEAFVDAHRCHEHRRHAIIAPQVFAVATVISVRFSSGEIDLADLSHSQEVIQ